MSARVSGGRVVFAGSEVPAHCRKAFSELIVEVSGGGGASDALELLSPDDRKQFSEQILASARAGSEVSKQICAVEHAFGIYMSQLQAGSGECDADSVLRGLQATIDSAQTQNAASRMNDTEYTQHLDRLVSNLKKHTSEGDDDEVQINDSITINTICPVTKSTMTQPRKLRACKHYIDQGSAEAILKVPKKNKQTGIMETLCPVPGCKRPFTLADVLLAPEVEHELQRQRQAGNSQRMSQHSAPRRRNIELGDD